MAVQYQAPVNLAAGALGYASLSAALPAWISGSGQVKFYITNNAAQAGYVVPATGTPTNSGQRLVSGIGNTLETVWLTCRHDKAGLPRIYFGGAYDIWVTAIVNGSFST